MSDIRSSTDVILDSVSPAKWLERADQYMIALTKIGDAILPREHAVLKPIVEAFHDDLAGFVEYVRALRDTLPPGEAKVEVHHFYRTLAVRLAQQVRRRRMEHALEKVGAMLGRELDADEKRRVAATLEKHWGSRRMKELQAGKHTGAGRLSTEERSQILEEFWNTVDKEIETGTFPMFKL